MFKKLAQKAVNFINSPSGKMLVAITEVVVVLVVINVAVKEGTNFIEGTLHPDGTDEQA